MKCCKYVSMVAIALTIIGALNWGLWGFFQFDLVAWLFKGNTTMLSRLVYSLIGIAGLLSLIRLRRCKSKCSCDCSCCKDKDSCKTNCCQK